MMEQPTRIAEPAAVAGDPVNADLLRLIDRAGEPMRLQATAHDNLVAARARLELHAGWQAFGLQLFVAIAACLVIIGGFATGHADVAMPALTALVGFVAGLGLARRRPAGGPLPPLKL